MAAIAVEQLPQLLTEVTKHFNKEEEAKIVNMISTTLGETYRNADNIPRIFDQLRRDNRINIRDTFLLEKCIGLGCNQQTVIEKLINNFKTKHRKEISTLEEQESFFVRRDGIYNKVDTILRNSHGVLLYGEAGVGKTFLAKHYLNSRHKDNFKKIDLREITDKNILMVNILEKFGHIKSTVDVDLKVLRSSLKKSAIKERVILFLDNSDDFIDQENKESKSETFSDVVETVIQAGGGLIKLVITSRNPSDTTKLNHMLMSHKVGQLEHFYARKLLEKSKMSCKPSDEMLDEAVKICKSLPLNLDLVGGMLQNFGTAIEEVTHIIQKYAETELKKISDEKLARRKEIEISTLGVLEANFDKLGDTVQQGAVALSLFCRPFQVKDVEFMFENIMAVNRLHLILHALKHQKVIQCFDDETFDFHPMVRSFLESKKDMSHISPFYQQAKTRFLFRFRTYFKEIAEMLNQSYDYGREIFQVDFVNFQLTFDMHITEGIPLFENYYDLQLTSGLLNAMFDKEWRIKFFEDAAKSCLTSGMAFLVLFFCIFLFSMKRNFNHRKETFGQ